MANQEVDQSKRKFLIAATSVAGGAAAAAVAVPFVTSMLPSERAKAAGAPVEADISKIEPGSMITVEWRGKPVWIVNRSQAMLDALAADARIPLDRKALDQLISAPLEFTGDARQHIARVVSRIEAITSAHPAAAQYKPGSIR